MPEEGRAGLIAEKDNPGLEVAGEFQEPVFPAGRHEDQVAGTEWILFRPILEQTLPADHDVNFVLRVRLLRVVAQGLVDLDRGIPLPEKFQKRITFGDMKRGECFGYADFHDK